ncbi:MAG: hypothetical protein J6S10_03050 [Clostridia bacterium]|nr:hypothetical protein [Clostridia bacterium]
MNRRVRQYLGRVCAAIVYYLVHEGAHLLYALAIGSFKHVNQMGLGMQIDIYPEIMTDTQLGVFCLLGFVATFVAAYVLVALADRIKNIRPKLIKACLYYTTIAMLLIDPLYLSVLCGLFGGGDMNGIRLIIPEPVVRISCVIILVINAFVFAKIVLPKYKLAFAEPSEHNLNNGEAQDEH